MSKEVEAFCRCGLSPEAGELDHPHTPHQQEEGVGPLQRPAVTRGGQSQAEESPKEAQERARSDEVSAS